MREPCNKATSLPSAVVFLTLSLCNYFYGGAVQFLPEYIAIHKPFSICSHVIRAESQYEWTAMFQCDYIYFRLLLQNNGNWHDHAYPHPFTHSLFCVPLLQRGEKKQNLDDQFLIILHEVSWLNVVRRLNRLVWYPSCERHCNWIPWHWSLM